MITLIKDGYIIDPASDREGIYDIIIIDGIIKKIGLKLDPNTYDFCKNNQNDVFVIEAKGKLVMPGFVDLHVHLREPGFEYKETIKTGAMAAAAGGYTAICPMPNTKPSTDSVKIIEYVLQKAKEEAMIHILPVGAITLEQDGAELANIPELIKAGAVAISEDGKSVMNTALYRESLLQASKNNIPVFAHCEDKELVGKGVINAGLKDIEFQLPGISNAVEDVIVARDIILAKETGARLHLCHCSTEDSVKMIQIAKEEGLPVTGEVCPHHFTLTEEDIRTDDSNYKMNPPLRSRKDKEALIQALKNDVIDVIATDHAPHSEEEKSKPFANAPFGIVGSETAFSLTYTELVKKGYLSYQQLVEKMSLNPARLIGLERGCIGEGWVADLVIADIEEEYSIDINSFLSKGKNTPFHGRKVYGRVLYTLVNGKIVYQYNSNPY